MTSFRMILLTVALVLLISTALAQGSATLQKADQAWQTAQQTAVEALLCRALTLDFHQKQQLDQQTLQVLQQAESEVIHTGCQILLTEGTDAYQAWLSSLNVVTETP